MEAQQRDLQARERATLQQAGAPRQTRLSFQVSPAGGPSPDPNHPAGNYPCCSSVARARTLRGSWRCSILRLLLPAHVLNRPHCIRCMFALSPTSHPPSCLTLSVSVSVSVSLLFCHPLLVRRLFWHPSLFVCPRRQPSLLLQRGVIE
jgi:hypothetical protein